MTTMNNLQINQEGTVKCVLNSGSIRRRFADIGLISGTKVSCVAISALGDPKAYLIRGSIMAIRNTDSKAVVLEEDYE